MANNLNCIYDGLTNLKERIEELKEFDKQCPGMDEPLSVRSGQHYYYHQDRLGSVVILSDLQGIPIQQYDYDSFGNPITFSRNGTEIELGDLPIENPYLFSGREFDRESGLYYHRARYYNPQIGRFLSEEPLSIDGPNLYWYARNNPINLIDPTGGFTLHAACHGLNIGLLAIELASVVFNAKLDIKTAEQVAQQFKNQANELLARIDDCTTPEETADIKRRAQELKNLAEEEVSGAKAQAKQEIYKIIYNYFEGEILTSKGIGKCQSTIFSAVKNLASFLF